MRLHFQCDLLLVPGPAENGFQLSGWIPSHHHSDGGLLLHHALGAAFGVFGATTERLNQVATKIQICRGKSVTKYDIQILGG